MGCDIHLFTEYKRRNNNDGYWSNFGGEFNLGRNYAMFGMLSQGVRSNFDEGFEARGIPNLDKLGYETRNGLLLYIVDNNDQEKRYCSKEQAEKWVKNDSSEYVNGLDGKPAWVTDPDTHSHSWLTMEEYSTALQNYYDYAKKAFGERNRETKYEAILGAMRTIEIDPELETRVVFWFDN